MTTYDGKPVEFIITPASTADITAFKLMEIDLPLDASIYGDKAYTQYSLEDDLQEKIRWIADRKTNATRQHSGCIQYLQSVLRKRIETTFRIHAVTKNGFLLKLVIFIVSYFIELAL